MAVKCLPDRGSQRVCLKGLRIPDYSRTDKLKNKKKGKKKI